MLRPITHLQVRKYDIDGQCHNLFYSLWRHDEVLYSEYNDKKGVWVLLEVVIIRDWVQGRDKILCNGFFYLDRHNGGVWWRLMVVGGWAVWMLLLLSGFRFAALAAALLLLLRRRSRSHTQPSCIRTNGHSNITQ